MSATTFLLPTILNVITVYLIGGGGACGQAQGADPDGNADGVEVALTQPGSYGGSNITTYTHLGSGRTYSISLALGAGGAGGVAPTGSSYTLTLGGTQTSKSVAGGTNGASNSVHLNCGDSDAGERAISRGYGTVAKCVCVYGSTNPDVDGYSRRNARAGSYPYNRFWFGRGNSYKKTTSTYCYTGYYVTLYVTTTQKHPWSTEATTSTLSLQTNAIVFLSEHTDEGSWETGGYYASCVDSDSQGNMTFGQTSGYGYAGIGGLARSTSGSQTHPFINGQPGGCQIIWY